MVSISPVPATAQLAGVIPLADRRPDSAAPRAAARSAAARPRKAAGELSLTLPGDSGYVLEAGARRTTVRRTWLDTFDWRLYRAGLTLEQVTGRGTAELRLTGRDGTLLAAERLRPAARGSQDGQGGRVPRWPALLAAVPPGPLAEELAPVVGVRALLPVVRATSVLREQRALNGDDKTIARITADQMSVTAADPLGAPVAAAPAVPAELPVRLTVTPVRGYQAQAARLESLLAGLPGVLPPGRPALEAALAAAGRRPGDYTGRIDVELTASMPAAAAMAAVMSALLDTLEANVPGTVRDIDTEFLHDLRVAVRRTRTAIKLTGQVLPGGARGSFRPEFKWLGDLTTPTRDLDVYLLGLPEMTAGLAGADPGDLDPFGEQLARQRARAQRDLARGLRSARFQRLLRDWRGALAEAAATARRKPTAARLAAGAIADAHQRVLADGAAITAASPATSLHELRKRCKELRYLLEIFASLHPPGAAWRAVKELKGLQDCLGEFQDTDVQRAELRAFATEMMAQRQAPAPTLLAMGEISGELARRQQQARTQFYGLFREFAAPAGQARFQPLTRPAAGQVTG
jgi:CHAD domain-containing protein